MFNRLALALLLFGQVESATKRCDWHGPKSSGESTFKKCVDYAAMEGKTVDLPKNVTRISADGISFCSGVFTKAGAGNADIVFIYDNSGSMRPDRAFIDVAKKDTLFYYGRGSNAGCDANGVNGSLKYDTKIGTRTIPLLTTNTGCNTSYAGDPYYSRALVMQSAIDFLVTNSPTSTAGAVSFTDVTSHERAPLQLSIAGNADLVKKSIVMDSNGGTHYGPPLEQAKSWLNNPAMIKTQRQAIIFISDGAPKDTAGNNSYLNLLDDKMPPVYSIYLGDATTPDTTRLKELSTTTGGSFTRVDPRNVTAVQQIMTDILKAITTTNTPKAVTVVNSSLTPPQTATSAAITVNADGSQGVTLDSIVGLKEGKNAIQIKVIKDDNTPITYSFTLNVAANEIGSSSGNYSCFDMPTLAAYDKAGLTPEIYRPDLTGYTLKLTRSPSELRLVSVEGTSEIGDKESIPLGNPNSALGFPSQTGDFKYDPKDGAPQLNNGVLEIDNAKGLTFVWTHPRDARETVTYLLPGRIIPTIDGNVVFKIKDPVTEGIVFTPMKLSNPVVIVDGQNKCLTNCSGTEIFWSNPGVPTWMVTIKSPIRYSVRIFDNLGQFVSMGQGEISQATWNSLAKSGDSSAIQLKLPPVTAEGQRFGTGAYLLMAEITALGSLVTKNSAGEMIIVKDSKREYLKKFGYVR